MNETHSEREKERSQPMNGHEAMLEEKKKHTRNIHVIICILIIYPLWLVSVHVHE